MKRPLLPARDTAAALAAWRTALDMAAMTDDDDVDRELLTDLAHATHHLDWCLFVRPEL